MLQNVMYSRLDYSDLQEVIATIKKVYIDRRALEYDLLGEPILSPYPILRIAGRVIRGYHVTPDRFRTLDPLPHGRRVLALDASLKVLFNCGSFKVIVSKVTWGIWRGFVCEDSGIFPIRIKVVWDKHEAAEWLLMVELASALKLLSRIRYGDYLLMDRSLMAVPSLRRETRKLFEKLDSIASAKGVTLIGITKVSQIRLNTGESLVGYLLYLANKRLKNLAWYYHPIFKQSSLPSWYMGDIVVAKLAEDAENAFRIDVSRRALMSHSLEQIMGELAFMQDPATPGYPYPLKSVHNASRFTEEELERIAAHFLELLEERGLLSKFLSDIRSSNFKEKYLWGIVS
ncbi:MAG: hypothetical protein DRJ51_02775 [Thermoprotei archaeon]|nr:MAG: hypothetical protein DRJ51_02775 [Thermoprotei archaeon]RLF02590.1 MAG: hypothetical protein DRJ59_03185 [Thermoprotei archaeon]